MAHRIKLAFESLDVGGAVMLRLVFGVIPTGERSGLLTHIAGGERFMVRADEKLSVFVELESALRASNGFR